MSLIRRVIIGRRFCTAVPRRAEDVMSNPDCRPSALKDRVDYLAGGNSLDTAVKYARLAVFSRIKTESTELTCQYIIERMVRDKRHKDAYDLYDFFFNKHNLRPNMHCCNSILESRFQQGLVDEALDFYRSIKSRYYANEHTFRILTKGLVESGRLDQAETLLKDATSDRSRFHEPDHVAFNTLIQGFLDLGNLDKANQVLSEFKRLWSVTTAFSKHPLDSEYENRVAFLMATFMEYWFKKGKEMEAMECYNQSLFANKFPILSETGNVFLKILIRYGKKNYAWDLYYEMLDQYGKDGIDNRHFGPRTVEIMVNECFIMGQCREAIETYNKARAKNRYVNGSYIIEKCCEIGMVKEAESLLANSVADGFRYIEEATFKTMMDAYVKAGRIDDAIETSNKMIDATLEELSFLF